MNPIKHKPVVLHPATIVSYIIGGARIERRSDDPVYRCEQGERVQFTATVRGFTAKKNWQGLQQAQIILRDIRFADGALAVEEQTLLHGIWSQDLHENSRIRFEARLLKVEKNGVVKDTILRPGKVEIL